MNPDRGRRKARRNSGMVRVRIKSTKMGWRPHTIGRKEVTGAPQTPKPPFLTVIYQAICQPWNTRIFVSYMKTG